MMAIGDAPAQIAKQAKATPQEEKPFHPQPLALTAVSRELHISPHDVAALANGAAIADAVAVADAKMLRTTASSLSAIEARVADSLDSVKRVVVEYLARGYEIARIIAPGTLTSRETTIDLSSVLGQPRGQRAEFEMWLDRLYAVDKEDVDLAIDKVYARFMDLMERHELEQAGDILRIVKVDRLQVETLLAFLAITVPATPCIPGRTNFYERVNARLEALRGVHETGRLLDGLR